MDHTDISVLSALTDDPLASFEKLGKGSGLSPSGAQKRIKKLVETGMLGKEFARAQIDYSVVGLESVAVLVQSNPSAWKDFEDACDAHPYTQFRIRVMGTTNGFFVVFAVPQNSRSLLLEFLEALKSRGVIHSYTVHLPVSRLGHSETRFTIFDPATGKWNFDWKAWEDEVRSSTASLPLPALSILHELDKADVAILRALSMDARAEKKGLAESLGLKDYELSRRLKFIEEHHVVSFYRVVHETGILGINMTVVIRCEASLDFTARITNSASHLPFQGSVYPLEDGFVIVANMAPAEVTSLVTLLQRTCKSVSLMWGDYNSSMKYFFDNDPSNFLDSGWNTERSYMVQAPLDEVAKTEVLAEAKAAGVGTS